MVGMHDWVLWSPITGLASFMWLAPKYIIDTVIKVGEWYRFYVDTWGAQLISELMTGPDGDWS